MFKYRPMLTSKAHTRALFRRERGGRRVTILALSGLVATGLVFGAGAGVGYRLADYAQQRDALDDTANLHALPVSVDVETLSRTLGTLQARMVRLEAVGEKLGAVAGFEDSELDFSQEPPLGGTGSADGRLPSARELQDGIDQLDRKLSYRQAQLEVMDRLLGRAEAQATLRPQGRPVRGGLLSSGYGVRTHPLSGRRQMHKGLDFALPAGAEIYAPASGMVVYSARKGAFGNVVEIDHGKGLTTRYAHNRRNRVQVGEFVSKGTVIAEVGSTGRSTGPHLHFEVLKHGKQIDPKPYLKSFTALDVVAGNPAKTSG